LEVYVSSAGESIEPLCRLWVDTVDKVAGSNCQSQFLEADSQLRRKKESDSWVHAISKSDSIAATENPSLSTLSTVSVICRLKWTSSLLRLLKVKRKEWTKSGLAPH
jgi:hypothetical protein